MTLWRNVATSHPLEYDSLPLAGEDGEDGETRGLR